MNLVTYYEPFNWLNQINRDVNRMLGRFDPLNNDSTVATSAWIPAVDLKEEADQFVIEADIPGVDPKDIEVSMEAGQLTIKGERKLENRDTVKGYHQVERLYGSFYRRFNLPDTADTEGVVATGKNGVLQIRIPKKPTVLPRKITVQA